MATYRKRKRSNGIPWILARIRIKGFKPVTKGFADLKAAKGWAEAEEANLREQRDRGATRPEASSLTLGQLIDEHVRDAATGSHKRTKKPLNKNGEVIGLLGWWKNHFGSRKVFDVGPVLLREARDLLQSSGVRGKRSDGSVNRYIAQMRSCWNWGRGAGLISHSRIWPERLMLPAPKGRIRFLSHDEIGRLLKAAESDKPIRAAIIISIATGMRQGEMLRLTWDDVDLERKTASLLETKNGDSRSVPLTAAAVTAFQTLKEAKEEGVDAVFLNLDGTPLQRRWLSRRWERILTAAEITNFHWHDLRHTCASILAQNGASLQEIQVLLGHKSMHMTFRYSHLVAGRAVTGHDKLDEMLQSKT